MRTTPSPSTTSEGGVWKIASTHTSAEPVRRERLLPKLPPVRDVHETLLIDQRIALALGLPATLLAMAGMEQRFRESR